MIQGYHRPSTLDEALELLAAGDASVLAGGTSLVAAGSATRVVDLQGLGLDRIDLDGDRLSIGAMARLYQIVDSDLVPALLRDLARREAPSIIRNAATLGGTIATRDWESELLAGLLVHDAALTVTGRDGPIPLPAYLSDPTPGIITAVSIATGGAGSSARTGRTPADRPIVCAVTRRDDTGGVHLALTGVALTPVLVDPLRLDELDPPPDFRGSADYRKHLAHTLASRAMEGLR